MTPHAIRLVAGMMNSGKDKGVMLKAADRIAELEKRIAAIKIDCEQREIYLSNVIEQTRKERYNAGMERAAEIAEDYSCYIGADRIRKEIEK